MQRDIENNVADLVMLATKSILKAEMPASVDREMVEKTIKASQ